jgi:YbbR domain-containing protein
MPMGLDPGLVAEIGPSQVSLQVTAPVDALQRVAAEDIAVFVDLRGLGPGIYTLVPTVTVPQGITWLGNDPQRVQVTIRAATDGTATPRASTPIATPR